MARVTIEDCMEVVGNRFALSVVAMKRAKSIVAKKIDLLEREKKLAEAMVSLDAAAEKGEIPVAEVVESNMDKSSRVQEENKPVIRALKEIADKKLRFSYSPNRR